MFSSEPVAIAWPQNSDLRRAEISTAIQPLGAMELIRIVSDDEESRRRGERMHIRYFILGAVSAKRCRVDLSH